MVMVEESFVVASVAASSRTPHAASEATAATEAMAAITFLRFT